MNNRIKISNLNSLDLNSIKIFENDHVVIKPNLVKEYQENNHELYEHVITSADLIRKVCFYVSSILKNTGKISICDAPQTDSSFKEISRKLKLEEIACECKSRYNTKIDIIDLRQEEWTNVEGIITKRKKLNGDPAGVICFNLGKDSLFYKHKGEGHYYGADYDSSIVNAHHHDEVQEYLISATPILADVFINIPKMKTHKKTGVTLSLKNLVGILGNKNYLPHHTVGSPKTGGDQFPDLSLFRKIENASVKFARKIALKFPDIGPKIVIKLRKQGTRVFGSNDNVIRSGNWYKNDTTWRMALDINRCLFYGNTDGTIRRDNPKRYYTIIDGLTGMEGNGPMQGAPVNSDAIFIGDDPVLTDIVAARYMGFDWNKTPIIREAYKLKELPLAFNKLDDLIIEDNIRNWTGNFDEFNKQEHCNFKPHFGWVNHIEYKNEKE